jgi:Flp pilus assembly protein TadB
VGGGQRRANTPGRAGDTLQWLQALDRALTHAASFPEAWSWSAAETPPGPLREALAAVMRRYHAGSSWGKAVLAGGAGLREPAARSLFRILGLCAHSQVSLRAARMALAEIAPSLQGLLETEAQLRAGTAAQRAQAVSLAVLVPCLSVGLQVFDPPYREVLWVTPLGRWVLLPAALSLELAGLTWSRRLTARLGG